MVVASFSGPVRALPRLVFAPSHEGREFYPRAIEALQLADTNLVVLAACDTASGPYSRSEGVLSLAKPFLKAGVPSIVATLWPVDDHAAGRLVTTFFRALLSGRDAAAALQAAPLATNRDSRYLVR